VTHTPNAIRIRANKATITIDVVGRIEGA